MSTLITRDYAVSSKRSWSPSGTYYVSIIGSLESNPARDDAAMKMVQAGKFSNLRVRVDSSGTLGQTSSVTLLKRDATSANWQATDLTVSWVGAGNNNHKTFENTDDEVEFSAGDLFCWEIVAQATGLFSLRHVLVRVQDQ